MWRPWVDSLVAVVLERPGFDGVVEFAGHVCHDVFVAPVDEAPLVAGLFLLLFS